MSHKKAIRDVVKTENHFNFTTDKQKGVQVSTRDVNGESVEVLTIEGYASTKNIDRQGDVVLPSAFTESLAYLKEHGKILLQHKHEYPIGKIIECSVDDNGLYIKAEITQNHLECMSAIKNGVLDGFSIGYRLLEWEFEDIGEDYVLVAKKVDCYEVSLVSVPANPFTFSKSLRKCHSVKATEEFVEPSGDDEAVAETPAVEAPVEAPAETPVVEAPAAAEEAKEVEPGAANPESVVDAAAPAVPAEETPAPAESENPPENAGSSETNGGEGKAVAAGKAAVAEEAKEKATAQPDATKAHLAEITKRMEDAETKALDNEKALNDMATALGESMETVKGLCLTVKAMKDLFTSLATTKGLVYKLPNERKPDALSLAVKEARSQY